MRIEGGKAGAECAGACSEHPRPGPVGERAGSPDQSPLRGGRRVFGGRWPVTKRRLRFLLGVLVSAVVLWLATRNLDWSEAVQALRAADSRLLLLALLAQCASYLVGAARWRALFPESASVRFRRLTAALLAAQLINVAFPVRLGPIARAYLVWEDSQRPTSLALATVAGEKLLDILALAVGAALLPQLLPVPAWAGQVGAGLALAAGGGLALVLLLAGGRRTLEAWLVRLGDRVAGAGASVLDGVAFWVRPGRAGRLVLWTAAVWVVGALVNLLVLRALRVDDRLSVAAVLLIVLQLGARVPSAPAGIGLFETLCIVGLGWFGVEPGLGLSYGLLLHMVVLAPGLVGGGLVLWRVPAVRAGLRRAADAWAGSG